MRSDENDKPHDWSVTLVDGSVVDARAARVAYQTLEDIISKDAAGFETLLQYANGTGSREDVPQTARDVFLPGDTETPLWKIAKPMLTQCAINTHEGYVIKDPFVQNEGTTAKLEELDARSDEFFRKLIRERRQRNDDGPGLN